ncbi:unnamed protein product [Acanthoscelides obtectus]|uniref:Protein FAM177B n=1 Tax=Acanthoscelides obtectus TaxID=200917 RepID=A0A9P0KXU7_ACAOB|nr:unnamed protein product [Acanthoscelides obtectus]CAK1637858.1 Protein FAM177A1 [Acanthoscelides obtectus]
MVLLRPENIKKMSEEKQARLKAKGPKGIFHFSDGDLEEYSTDEEDTVDKGAKENSLVDPRTLTWGPWISYLMWSFGSSTLSVVDTMGEFFAKAFGITTPRYYFELEEHKKREEEQATRDAEAQGWSQPASGSAVDSTITSLNEIPNRPHPVDV